MRTVWGDHERFFQTYFSTYPGLYFTGDGCRRDEDGYYWITGRVDDVINVSGHRIGTAEVESALVAHPLVAEAAVVGAPHDIKGQGIHAFVTLNAGEEGSDALKAASSTRKCASTSARSPRPRASSSPRRCPRRARARSCAASCARSPRAQTDGFGDISTLADPGGGRGAGRGARSEVTRRALARDGPHLLPRRRARRLQRAAARRAADVRSARLLHRPVARRGHAQGAAQGAACRSASKATAAPTARAGSSSTRRSTKAASRRASAAGCFARPRPTTMTGTITDNPGPVSGRLDGNRLLLNYTMKGGLKAEQVLTLQPGGRIADQPHDGAQVRHAGGARRRSDHQGRLTPLRRARRSGYPVAPRGAANERQTATQTMVDGARRHRFVGGHRVRMV